MNWGVSACRGLLLWTPPQAKVKESLPQSRPFIEGFLFEFSQGSWICACLHEAVKAASFPWNAAIQWSYVKMKFQNFLLQFAFVDVVSLKTLYEGGLQKYVRTRQIGPSFLQDFELVRISKEECLRWLVEVRALSAARAPLLSWAFGVIIWKLSCIRYPISLRSNPQGNFFTGQLTVLKMF